MNQDLVLPQTKKPKIEIEGFKKFGLFCQQKLRENNISLSTAYDMDTQQYAIRGSKEISEIDLSLKTEAKPGSASVFRPQQK